METQIIRFAPSKLNLHLAVGPLEQSGLHSIQSLFVTTSLADTLTITVTDSDTFSITVTGLEEYCEPGSDTITKAARLYNEYIPLSYTLHVHCEKRIPTQAGLGGGSSDAASLLLALDELKPIDEATLLEIAHRVGSDVPFFIYEAKAAIVEGTGEVVTPLEAPVKAAVVVMPTDHGVSTKEAYAALDRIEDRSTTFVDRTDLGESFKDSIPNWSNTFYNDFEQTLTNNPLYGELAKLSAGYSGYQGLTGSGPSWFFIADSDQEVDLLTQKIVDRFGTFVATYRLMVCSEVI